MCRVSGDIHIILFIPIDDAVPHTYKVGQATRPIRQDLSGPFAGLYPNDTLVCNLLLEAHVLIAAHERSVTTLTYSLVHDYAADARYLRYQWKHYAYSLRSSRA